MLGIITLAVFIIFFRFSITLSKWLTYRLKCPPAVVFFTRVAIVVGVAHLMVIDEHIGKYQIDRLCKSHGLRNTDLSKTYGKSVTRNVVGLTPKYIKDAKQKKLFVGKKIGAKIKFNPVKAMENEYEVSSMLNINKDKVKDYDRDFEYVIKDITNHQNADIDQDLFDKVLDKGVAKKYR